MPQFVHPKRAESRKFVTSGGGRLLILTGSNYRPDVVKTNTTGGYRLMDTNEIEVQGEQSGGEAAVLVGGLTEHQQISKARKREFGKRVRLLREAKRWTQEELAADSGLSRSYVSRLELGDIALPRNDKLTRLARALGTSNEDLLEAAGYMTPPSNDQEGSLPDLAPYLRRKYGLSQPRLVDLIQYMVEMAQREGSGTPPASNESADEAAELAAAEDNR